jgi:hypothetical protein
LGEWRSSLRVEDFCLNTGLDRDIVEKLVRERFLEDSLWTWEEPSCMKSIFMDALPSRETLVAMGLPVREDYDPENLRYGGIECATHGWAQSVLLTRYDADNRELPDQSMCWECSQAGVPPDSGNSTPIEPDRVERWRRTHDRDGNWIGSEEDE